MAVVLAKDAEAGVVYRRTTHVNPGTYYMKVKETKRMNPRAWVDRLVLKRDPLGGFWFQTLKARPDSVLMARYIRGKCSTTGEKWEHKKLTLVPPDMRLRAVKTRPGYTR